MLFRHKKYLLFIVIVIISFFLIWQLSQLWAIRASFSQARTYPKASVLGIKVGDLSVDQLNSQITKLKSEFETRKVTLDHNKDQWTFDFSKLGISIDSQTTVRAILNLNNLSFVDKYRLLTGAISPVVEPTIIVDSEKCIESLSTISIPQVEPRDAIFYFDKEIKLKPDEPGAKFNAKSTCLGLSKRLAINSFETNVNMDVVSANLTKLDLESKISQIQSLAGRTLSFRNGAYKKDITPEQLLSLLDITKSDKNVQVGWSSTKLDELINSVATDVNTYNSAPVIGACQTLISSGGNWLDKEATKKSIVDLGADSPISYTLPVGYYAPVVSTITPVSHGNSGTVYLTFDDGLQYGNQIMNYASCYGIKVTFFEIGSRADVDAASLRRAVSEGHAVQSHGYEHSAYDYGSHDFTWQNNDIKQSINAITNITGVRPTYFRPPGGNRSASTYDAANNNGLKLILWSVSSADTVTSFGSSTICSNVLAGVFPGASVLMHSSKQTTANAVPCIIEGLAARGYNMQALR